MNNFDVKILIFLPAYNEEKNIIKVIKDIYSVFGNSNRFGVLVVDDGSTDKTAEKVRMETSASIISIPKNLGLGNAFSIGVQESLKRRVDIMVSMDSDGQFDALDIQRIIKPIAESKIDFVSGSRFQKGFLPAKMPAVKIIGNQIMARFISWVSEKKFTDVSCGFRAYSKESLLYLNLFGKFTYTQEVILNLSFKGLEMAEIPIKVKYFPQRKSLISDNLLIYCYNTLKIIFRTISDYKALKFFGRIGIFLFFIGVILDIVMLNIFFDTGQFTPYKFVGIFGLIFNILGLILLILGIVADMLRRIRENQERMIYYLKKRIYYEQ